MKRPRGCDCDCQNWTPPSVSRTIETAVSRIAVVVLPIRMLGCPRCGGSFTSSRALFSHFSICEAKHNSDFVDAPVTLEATQGHTIQAKSQIPTQIAPSASYDQRLCGQNPSIIPNLNNQFNFGPPETTMANIHHSMPTHDHTLELGTTALESIDCHSEPEVVPSCEGTRKLKLS